MVTVDKTSDPGTFQPLWIFNGIDEGEPVRVPGFADKSYGMWGDWGASGSITLQGSWDKSSLPAPDSWLTLYDADATGGAITLTANGSCMIAENPIWIRPVCTVAPINVKVGLNCTLSAGAK